MGKNLIKEYREKKGLRQKDLCKELRAIDPNIDVSLISKMENGVCRPSSAISRYINKALASPVEKSNCDGGVIIPLNQNERIWNVREVAVAFGVTPDSIYSWFKSRGINLKNKGCRGITDFQFERLVFSYKEGHFGSRQTKLDQGEIIEAKAFINKILNTPQVTVEEVITKDGDEF